MTKYFLKHHDDGSKTVIIVKNNEIIHTEKVEDDLLVRRIKELTVEYPMGRTT